MSDEKSTEEGIDEIAAIADELEPDVELADDVIESFTVGQLRAIVKQMRAAFAEPDDDDELGAE